MLSWRSSASIGSESGVKTGGIDAAGRIVRYGNECPKDPSEDLPGLLAEENRDDVDRDWLL